MDGDLRSEDDLSVEAIQEAGGEWHDNLALAALARKRLGKKAGLVGFFERKEELALRRFRECLAEPESKAGADSAFSTSAGSAVR